MYFLLFTYVLSSDYIFLVAVKKNYFSLLSNGGLFIFNYFYLSVHINEIGTKLERRKGVFYEK